MRVSLFFFFLSSHFLIFCLCVRELENINAVKVKYALCVLAAVLALLITPGPGNNSWYMIETCNTRHRFPSIVSKVH